jgi:hypothetical protein
MGACESEIKPEKKVVKQKKKSNNKHEENLFNKEIGKEAVVKQVNEITSFPELPDEYKDMKLVENEVFVGEGIKRDRAYRCDLKIDEINAKRNSFWSQRLGTKFSKIVSDNWKQIRTACYVDHGMFFNFYF